MIFIPGSLISWTLDDSSNHPIPGLNPCNVEPPHWYGNFCRNRRSISSQHGCRRRAAFECIFSAARSRAGHIGDKKMEIAQRTRFETAQRKVRSYDATILLGYAAFAIVLLAGIYWGSVSSGIAPGDLASMTVFP
jgi:hypothetical protein